MPRGVRWGRWSGLDGLEKLTHAVILEAFRDSEHEPVLKRIAGELLEKHLDIDVASAVFGDAINAIRTRNPNPRIKELEVKDASEGLYNAGVRGVQAADRGQCSVETASERPIHCAIIRPFFRPTPSPGKSWQTES